MCKPQLLWCPPDAGPWGAINMCMQVSQQKKALGEANHELTEKYNQKAMWVQA